MKSDLTRNCPRVVISAGHKSSGKTVTTVGICAALAERGINVQPYKKGPDYIDPGWLSTAAGKECHNLDYFMTGWDGVLDVFSRHSRNSDVNIIEGNKGLYDSIEVDGEGSTANLARHLNAPVVIVLDTSRITRGVAPLLLGYKAFEPDIRIAGVILNKVASARHEQKLRAVIEKYCDMEILGVIRKSKEMEVLERHLGLMPAGEEMGLYPAVKEIAKVVGASVNLDRILEIASSAEPMAFEPVKSATFPTPSVTIGVVKDKAFTFYYPENLEALRSAGANLVPVNSLMDGRLPENIDALYVGGGFPEAFMEKIGMNESLREDIRLSIENGMPVHAECGGLIYLAKSVSWKNVTAPMVGALDCEVIIRKRPKGHGYMTLKSTGKSPWITCVGEMKAHEFHYGEVVNSSHTDFAFDVLRGNGIDGKHDGIVYKNVTASFCHLHHLGCTNWAEGFVNFAKRINYSKLPKSLFSLSKETSLEKVTI
ncbi:MAG: hydrogenobyrinic acid a,c-diamide synthase (glutamine-hydrolyzing) [Nitrospinota bacterium]|nr:hydrogenobyrinic acid a,c-diamide synthase (glutamine-hydrolyzing) [Nitrospinota bacterium]